MISSIDQITQLPDDCIKSALSYIDPVFLSNLLEVSTSDAIKNKILKNLSEETQKKIRLHNRSLDQDINKEDLENKFLAIVNRVMNFR